MTNQSFLNKVRKDKFLLVLSLPEAFKELNPEIGVREIQISVIGTPVPGTSIPAKTEEWGGQSLKVTSQVRAPYDPIKVKFTIDNEFSNYWILWKWLDLINDSVTSGMNNYFQKYSQITQTEPLTRQENKIVINKEQGTSVYFDYMTNLTIYGLDEYNNKKIKFVYTKAFITDLADIDYSYRDGDEIECSATFAFSQLHAELMSECSNSNNN